MERERALVGGREEELQGEESRVGPGTRAYTHAHSHTHTYIWSPYLIKDPREVRKLWKIKMTLRVNQARSAGRLQKPAQSGDFLCWGELPSLCALGRGAASQPQRGVKGSVCPH